MTDTESIELDDDARDELLGNGGTGVISLSTAADDAPHSLPVSYGYDATAETFYFRLATDGDSEKGELADRPVSFVTYDQTDDEWQSVVAAGVLESTANEEIATETLAGLERVTIPYVDIFGEPLEDVSFEFYRLDPASLTARQESTPV